jgi:hypothetical protein
MSKDVLSGLQFHHYTEYGDSVHVVEATHPEHGEVGFMQWAKTPLDNHQAGEITNIVTHQPFQRQGVASAIYNYSQQFSPAPMHSKKLTQRGGGAKWAAAVGGPSV